MYLAFNNDMTLNGYQFEIGKTYDIKRDPDLLKIGLNVHASVLDCLDGKDATCRVCEIKAEDIVESEEGKRICRKITIVRELSKPEIMDKISQSLYTSLWTRNKQS